MEKRVYSIGGRDFSPASITARQIMLVNRALREAVTSVGIDANGIENPMLIYAAIWTALVETEQVAHFLSLIIVPAGEEWSEPSARSVEGFLLSCNPDDVAGLYTAASTSFFSGNPNSTQNIFLSLTGYIRNSAPLVKAWHKNLEEAAAARNHSIQQDAPASTASI